MTSAAAEWDMFIVNGLEPVFILIFQCDGPRECLGYVQVDADARVGCIPPLLRGLRRFDIYANGVTDTCQDLLEPEFLWEGV